MNKNYKRRGVVELICLLIMLVIVVYMLAPVLIIGYGVYKAETSDEKPVINLETNQEKSQAHKVKVIKFYVDNGLKYIDVKFVEEDKFDTFIFQNLQDEKIKTLSILIAPDKVYEITVKNKSIVDLKEIIAEPIKTDEKTRQEDGRSRFRRL